MRTPHKSRGPSGFDAILYIAQRGIPVTSAAGRDCAIDIRFRRLPEGLRTIGRFASQKFPAAPQPGATKELTPTQEIYPAFGFCVTTSPLVGPVPYRRHWRNRQSSWSRFPTAEPSAALLGTMRVTP